jgi:putative hydroxymethylpyrimidine transport system substrate-binding protein
MRRRHAAAWVVLGCVLVFLAAALAVQQLLQRASPREPELATVRVSLDFFPNPNHIPLYVALDEGYFVEEGLRVEVFVPANPSDPVKLASSRAVEISFTPQINFLIARSEGLPLISIGALIGQPLGGLVALRSAGIEVLEDLAGRRIGYSLAPLEPALWGTVFECAGMDPAGVEWVNVGYSTITALITGQVKAIGGFRNYEVLQLEEMGFDPVFFPQEEYCVPMTYELILVCHPEFADQQTPTAAAFVRALVRGIETTLRDSKRASALFFDRFPELQDRLNLRSFDHTLPLYARGAFHADPTVWETLQEYLVERGLMVQAFPVSSLVTDETLPRP